MVRGWAVWHGIEPLLALHAESRGVLRGLLPATVPPSPPPLRPCRCRLDRNPALTAGGLPRELAQLSNLQELYLDQTGVDLQAVAPELALLPALRKLYGAGTAPAAQAQLQAAAQGAPGAAVAAGILQKSLPFS